MKNKIQCFSLLLLLMLITLLSSGFVFINDPVELDPNRHKIFSSVTFEELLTGVQGGEDSCYAVNGKISAIGKRYDSFRITSEDGKAYVSCHTKVTDVKNKIAYFSEGDSVTAYGTFKKQILGGGISGEIDIIEEGSIKTGEGVFSSAGGKIFDGSVTIGRKIVNSLKAGSDVITYRIPAEWEEAEYELDDKGDHIRGFRYGLNRLDKKSVPESLYVFYFDYNKNLADRSQYGMTGRIEKALIENILGIKDAGKCPESERKAPYGVVYQYYDDKYEHGDDIYHAEFVFRKNADKGLMVLLYIYRIPDRVDEVMYLMRTTKIK
ncbi:MAG: hypothetical protein IJU87_04200 [Lachnospiraceae bacterium]|nr:hypothetical protein [Lachnospiraceae bacterium]